MTTITTEQAAVRHMTLDTLADLILCCEEVGMLPQDNLLMAAALMEIGAIAIDPQYNPKNHQGAKYWASHFESLMVRASLALGLGV
jgi:hypothetical protein